MNSSIMHATRMTKSIFNGAGRILGLAMGVGLVLCATRAQAASVTGVYTSYAGAPLGDHQLHFDNLVSGDIFLARTGSDGSFSADLPPGSYDLRAEHGAVVVSSIIVSDGDVSVGKVHGGQPFDMIWLPFERQGIAPALVGTDAPATAHVSTPSAEASSADATPPQSAATFWSPGNPAPAAPASKP